jgi:hypothetical protein
VDQQVIFFCFGVAERPPPPQFGKQGSFFPVVLFALKTQSRQEKMGTYI